VQPQHRPAGAGPELDEVAQLVDQPQAAAAPGSRRRCPPTYERVDDRPAARNLADELPGAAPGARDAAGTANVAITVALYALAPIGAVVTITRRDATTEAPDARALARAT